MVFALFNSCSSRSATHVATLARKSTRHVRRTNTGSIKTAPPFNQPKRATARARDRPRVARQGAPRHHCRARAVALGALSGVTSQLVTAQTHALSSSQVLCLAPHASGSAPSLWLCVARRALYYELSDVTTLLRWSASLFHQLAPRPVQWRYGRAAGPAGRHRCASCHVRICLRTV